MSGENSPSPLHLTEPYGSRAVMIFLYLIQKCKSQQHHDHIVNVIIQPQLRGSRLNS